MTGILNPLIAAIMAVRAHFAGPTPIIGRKISSITTASGGTHNTQTYPAGVKNVRLLPLTSPILVCWNAPTVAAADGILADATQDADVLLYDYVPAGAWFERTFDTPITTWTMIAIGTATSAYQQVTP